MENINQLQRQGRRIILSVMIIFMAVLSINLVLGAEFDNIKSVLEITKDQALTIGDKQVIYTDLWEKYPPIKIDNWFGVGENLMTGAITKNTESCGTDCYSEVQIYISNEGVLIENIKFIGAEVKNPKFYLKTGEKGTGIFEDIYKKVCTNGKVLANGTIQQNCIIEKTKGNEIMEDTWEEYILGTEVVAGTYTIKLEGEKDFYKSTDWIITSQGKEITEWADWGAGGTITYDGDYTIHTFYTNGTFTPSTANVVSVLVVAGGGSGAPSGAGGGGGGAGGVIMNYTYNLTSPSYNVVVGSGGVGWADAENSFYNNRLNGGSNSSFGDLIAMGGGAGSGGDVTGQIGASGGGGDGGYGSAGGASSSNQGNNGGSGTAGGTYAGGGGGGYSAVGETAPAPNIGGDGGVGILFNINGTDVYYGCGGGGGTYGIGGASFAGQAICGQGNGTIGGTGNGYDGADYTGAGGGGTGPGNGAGNTTAYSGSGGDGVVIIRYPTNYTPSSVVTTTLNNPVDYYNSTSNAVTFNCSAITTIGTIDTIQLWLNQTGTWVLNETAVTSPAIFTKSISEGNKWQWTCWANDSSGESDWATNRSLTVDTINPTISANILNPIISTNLDNVSVNYTILDLNLQTCWYNYAGVNTSYYCLNGVNNITNVTSSYPNTTIIIYANDTSGHQSSYNLIFSYDITAPNFVLVSLSNVSTLTLPVNATINVSTSSNRQSCWYNTSDSATTIIYTCNTETNVTFTTGGTKTIYIFANNSFGIVNGTSYPVNIYDFGVTQKGATIGSDGGSYTYNLTIISKSFDIGDADADFWYGTAGNLHYTTKTVLNSSAILFEKTYVLPNGTGNTTGKTNNWWWVYNTTHLTTRNTTAQTQTVYSVAIGDCLTSGYARMILNLTLKDEELNTLIDTPATVNATIELDLDITSKDNSSMIWSFSKTWINSSNATVCVPDGLLNNSEYTIDFTVGYDTTSRVREFYYLENGTLDNTNNFNSYTDNTIDLMDLLTADSTTFLFTYTDANKQEVDNIIVHTFRDYIGDGIFREVERSKQDDNGETHVHLVEEDVIYYFMITQGGTILYTSGTYNAKCLSTPCEIILSASADEIDWGQITNEGNQYTVSSDKSTRLTTISFALNSSRLVNVSLYSLEDGVTMTLVNSSSTTGSSGSIILYVPLSYGNTTFFVSIYDNGVFVKSSWVDLTTRGQDYFGTVGALLGGIIVLALLLMAVSEGAGVIVFTVLALIVISIMKLVDLGWMALISIICAGGIIIWKLVNRSRRAG